MICWQLYTGNVKTSDSAGADDTDNDNADNDNTAVSHFSLPTGMYPMETVTLGSSDATFGGNGFFVSKVTYGRSSVPQNVPCDLKCLLESF